MEERNSAVGGFGGGQGILKKVIEEDGVKEYVYDDGSSTVVASGWSSIIVSDAKPTPLKIYLSGDWYNPPLYLSQKLESSGYQIPHKWWERKDKFYANPEHFRAAIEECDVYIMELVNAPSYGCYMGAGVALASGKKIFVVCGDMMETSRPRTALLLPFTISETNLFPVLSDYDKNRV